MIFFKRVKHTIAIPACLFLLSILIPAHLFAQGDLMIYPKRINFENLKRAQDLSLINNGKDTARYVISVVQIRMKADGRFETINEPDSGQHFADKNFRFFPRAVILAPNESQTVRIQLIKTSELTAGEYRSHLYFRAEKEQKPLGQRIAEKKNNSIEISIVPVFGISIPIIVRVGESTTKVEIVEKEIKTIKNGKPTLNIQINRSGNMSVYGDISVEHLSTSGKLTKVGLIQGVAIYAPTPSRNFQIPLDNSKGITFNTGKLQINYFEPSGNKIKFAETELLLN